MNEESNVGHSHTSVVFPLLNAEVKVSEMENSFDGPLMLIYYGHSRFLFWVMQCVNTNFEDSFVNSEFLCGFLSKHQGVNTRKIIQRLTKM